MILIAMIEKARKILDRVGTFGVLLADLSKAFCYMTHDLITKHYVLTYDMNALNLIFDYMTGRKQRVKVNYSFSCNIDLFQGMAQGSVLGQLLFNLFVCDLFLFVKEADIMSYADDSTPFVCSENFDVTLKTPEEIGKILLNCFQTII